MLAFTFFFYVSLAAAQMDDQVHLSLTGKSGELAVDFMSHHENCSSSSFGIVIDSSPDFTSKDFVAAYNCTDFSKFESTKTLAIRVLLTHLVIGNKYYYIVGSPDDMRYAAVRTFTYGTQFQRPGGAVYAVIADFGYLNSNSLDKLMFDSYTGRFDALLHAGDFAYDFDADGGRTGDNYMRQIDPIVSKVPYNGIPGNHEAGSNYTHYKTRFSAVAENAGVNSGSGTNMFYSVDDGLVHFIFWDSEAYWSQPVDSQTAMMNWLKADLVKANANRETVPWVIALAHKTWFMEATIQCPSGAGCDIWRVLEEGGVDIHFMGHIHYYARYIPTYPNAHNGTGVEDTACMNNSLGNATNPAGIFTNPLYMTSICTAAPGDIEANRRRSLSAPHETAVGAGVSTVTSTNNYGYGYLNIVNSTHLHWRFETSVAHVNSSSPFYTDDLTLIVESHGPRTNLPPV